MAADYVAHVENNPYTALYEAPGLDALLPPVAGLRVLDAGCGGGPNPLVRRRQARTLRG